MLRRITIDFKRECAELVIIHGYSHKDAATAMKVGLSSIQHLVTQYKKELSGIRPKTYALTPEQLKIHELEKQLKQVQSDNELLKKLQSSSQSK
ncbi:hypothetical protein [Photobacterium leiognathi]|uniref:hypothetical protein n=1 Tax=Photobacterium leiognathi TaxID=553611 RepID=UPI002980BDBC|nr:hypothetical protein [Photobacterium leiognathi]